MESDLPTESVDQFVYPGESDQPVRRKIRLVFGLLLAFILCVFVLASAKPPARKYPNRTKVVFWHRWGGEWEKVVGNIIDRFNESQTEYEVQGMFVTGSGSDAKLILSTTGGVPPDVMSIWNGAIPTFASGGLLTDLETLMTPAERDYFHRVPYPSIRESGQYRGRTYGITIGADLYGYYVNCDQLRAKGINPDNPPATFEELVIIGQALDIYDQGVLTRMGLSVSSLLTHSYAWGDGFYDSTNHKLLMNTPSQVQALAAMVNQKKTVGFDNATRFWESQNSSSSTGAWPFIAGAVSIAYDGQWRVEEIRKYKKGMDYRVWPVIPPAKGKPLAGAVGGNFMIIPQSAKQKKGAFEFVKFWSGLTKPERAAEFYTWGGWLPLSPDVANSPIYSSYLKENPQFKTFVNILGGPNCHSMPSVGYLQFYLDQIQRAEDSALRGSQSPEATLKQMQIRVQEELKKRKELGFDD